MRAPRQEKLSTSSKAHGRASLTASGHNSQISLRLPSLATCLKVQIPQFPIVALFFSYLCLYLSPRHSSLHCFQHMYCLFSTLKCVVNDGRDLVCSLTIISWVLMRVPVVSDTQWVLLESHFQLDQNTHLLADMLWASAGQDTGK